MGLKGFILVGTKKGIKGGDKMVCAGWNINPNVALMHGSKAS